MRWTCYFVLLSTAIGCRSQSTPLTNPFMAPDRVPPPATQTLAPGSAQPYYPGDPVQGAPAAVTPGAVYPPGGTPTYSTPGYPPQTAPVTPPGGWSQPPTTSPYGVQPTSGYTPLAPNVADNSTVRISPDDQNLRFASVPNNNPNDLMQVAANQQLSTTTPYIYTQPMIEQQGFPNNLQPAQFAATNLSGAASDGFRPQGSTKQTVAPPRTQPIANQNSNFIQEDPNHFGFDATYSWLRGQLQYYPHSGEWGLRYIAQQGAPDPYGGVAVIGNPEVLGGVQPGEYLLVQGFLETLDNGDGTFVPLYTVEGIQRQR